MFGASLSFHNIKIDANKFAQKKTRIMILRIRCIALFDYEFSFIRSDKQATHSSNLAEA